MEVPISGTRALSPPRTAQGSVGGVLRGARILQYGFGNTPGKFFETETFVRAF